MRPEIQKTYNTYEIPPHVREEFDILSATLKQNHAYLRDIVSEDVTASLSIVTSYITNNLSGLVRGQDYLDRHIRTPQEEQWLSEHAVVNQFPKSKGRETKLGRLGHVIALHPKKDFIADLMKQHPFLPGNARIEPHVARLLTHTDAPECENFALAVITHMQQQDSIPTSHGDNNDAFQFWTYGPYVHDALGGDFEKYMHTWVLPRRQKGLHAEYPGIEAMYRSFSVRFHYLGKEGNDFSHRFVRMIVDQAILPATH